MSHDHRTPRMRSTSGDRDRPQRPVLAPKREPATAPIFEDEFFRQMVGGQLEREPVATEPPATPAEAPEARVSPTPAVPASSPRGPRPRSGRRPQTAVGGRGGGPRPPAQGVRMPPTPRWVAAAALVGVAVVALATATRGGQPAAESLDPPTKTAAPAVIPADADAAGAGGGSVELDVHWAAARRASNGDATRLRLGWSDGGRAHIRGRLALPAGYGGDRSVIIFASDADRSSSPRVRIGRVWPDGDGHFGTAIAVDRGAARKLLTFVPSGAQSDGARASAHALLEVEGAITAVARRRSGRIVLSGRTRPAGSVVDVSVHRSGRRERTARTAVRSSSDGRWQVLYTPGTAARVHRFAVRVLADPRRGFVGSRRPLVVRER